MDDHDQRFKGLLRAFFAEFLRLFFPDWAAHLEPDRAEFQDQETFLDPPQGERRLLDLVARVPTKAAVADPSGRAEDAWYVLVHVEVESSDRVAPFRPRMFTYYQALRQRHQGPVWPVALFLRTALDGVGWDVYEERLWGRTLLRFEYAYIGLPALDGTAYLTGPSLLGVALAALMRLPADRQAELKFEAMQRLACSGENEARKYMLAECLEAYFPLDAAQIEEYERLRAVRAESGGENHGDRLDRKRDRTRDRTRDRAGPRAGAAGAAPEDAGKEIRARRRVGCREGSGDADGPARRRPVRRW